MNRFSCAEFAQLRPGEVAKELELSLYYLHLANDRGVTVDETGREFDRKELAIVEASRTAGAILADELGNCPGEVSIKVYVEDDNKCHLATVAVSGSLTL